MVEKMDSKFGVKYSVGDTSQQRQMIRAQEGQVGSLVLFGETELWRAQVFLLGFSTRCEQGHGESTNLDPPLSGSK